MAHLNAFEAVLKSEESFVRENEAHREMVAGMILKVQPSHCLSELRLMCVGG